ncbi:TetR/AcrR family transcriptional regulator [Hyphomonas sp.]|uniref:TetR/AcrR family transcriptional regulator n=1 Tax=Hyphomonas sp. TaxID=87 RepID=UPI00391B267B
MPRTLDPDVSERRLQARAVETRERLIAAAQAILERGGLEALNSNAVAAEAGATPPSFYRYFGNKYDLLAELGRRLMSAQNQIIERQVGGGNHPQRYSQRAMEFVLQETLAATRAFRGGRAIISSLRAAPELAPVRLESHAHVAAIMAKEMAGGRRGRARTEAFERARLAVELGYAAIEMLLEVPELDTDRVLKSAARAISHCLAQ